MNSSLRRLFLFVACCVTHLHGATLHAATPNFIIILADDLGYGDVGYHGGQARTPHLDRLASEGVRLEQHYVFATCSPTRAALLSGRYASRFGCTGPTNDRVFSPDTVTLPAALKTIGYKTALIGKWHLGSRLEWNANQHGFDHSHGPLAGGTGPYCHTYQAGPFSRTWQRDGVFLDEEGHVTDLLADAALKWLEANKGSPFFLYLPFTAPHIPLDEPESWLKMNGHITDPAQRLHAACISHFDDTVGQIIAALKKHQIEDNTLVLFLSDNGAYGLDRNDREYPGRYPNLMVKGSNAPFRGFKGSLFEGGIRTPAIAWCPGKLKPGVIDHPLHVCDWMPTLCSLVGINLQVPWDGLDIWPQLADHAAPPSRTFYWKTARTSALREGDWKLIVGPGEDISLYHLARDPHEDTNLASKHPEKVQHLLSLLQKEALTE